LFVKLELSGEYNAFYFFVFEQDLFFWEPSVTISDRTQTIELKMIIKMAVSKSAPRSYQNKIIGRRRNLSRYTDVILSNDTIKEQDERRLFSQGTTRF
jgi:hypothetical protein